MDKLTRRVVLVPEGLWRKLKALLASRGETVSGWFRVVAQREVDETEEDRWIATRSS